MTTLSDDFMEILMFGNGFIRDAKRCKSRGLNSVLCDLRKKKYYQSDVIEDDIKDQKSNIQYKLESKSE